jgi:hypothetical protein
MKIGFVELLTLLLIALKLLGKISISWLLVLSPLIVVYGLALVVAVLAAAVVAIAGRKK